MLVVVNAVAPRDDNTSCPSGKAFYSCVSNRFMGCCSTNPCSLRGCPDDAAVADRGDHVDGEDTSSASSEKQPQTASRKTDSGITHTIPNHSVVTVTRHTVVFSEAPSPTPTPSPTLTEQPLTSSASVTATEASPSASSGTDGSGAGHGGNAFSSGTIVGISVGGVIFSAVLFVVVMAWRRHRRRDKVEDLAFQGIGEEDEDKGQQSMSAHTTGTQASSTDPFAPFGGRADRPQGPPPSLNGAVEMDGTSMVPVELPAEPATPSQPAVKPYQPYKGLSSVPHSPATDPRANLNLIKTDSGQAGYVNHWNQWRALASSGAGGSGSGGGREDAVELS